ncbi:MAG: hypothetical protein WC728_13570 [Elusimicrobiota bacterium]
MRYSLVALFLAVSVCSGETWKDILTPADKCSCPFPGVRGMPQLPKPAHEGWVWAADQLETAGRTSMGFYHAHIRGGEASRVTLKSFACHDCDKVLSAYDVYENANYDAFDKRMKAELKEFPEGALKWEDSTPEDFDREKGKEAEDPLELASACRRPKPPIRLVAPKAKGKLSEKARKALERLERDTERFNKGLEKEYEAFLGMLPYERAYGCREVLEAYEGLRTAEFEAFDGRRDKALAEVAVEMVEWKAP